MAFGNRIYLTDFSFPSLFAEDADLCHEPETEYYPYRILSSRGLFEMAFAPITILYGGNGSGKSTALNVMASKMGVRRDAPYNPGPYFERFLSRTNFNRTISEGCKVIPGRSAFIASEDIFDMLLEIRGINRDLEAQREELRDEWMKAQSRPSFNLETIHGQMYEDWARVAKLKRARQSLARTTREEIRANVKIGSNGENAFETFVMRLQANALYLLDEPENSLSAAWQSRLAGYIENLARYENCQFVIATHSPFLLSLPEAKIYDLDTKDCPVREWTELENVQMYYKLFQKHAAEFRHGGKV